jgi:phosphatidylglycerol:prolipoprotein diacylglycerol transferase
LYPYIHIGPLIISNYFLVISLAATFSMLWFLRRAKSRGLSRLMSIDLTIVIMVSGFVGARLFHVFYEEPDLYREHWQRVFLFWQGGFVFFGGALTALLAGYIYCIWNKEPFLYLADVAAPTVSLAYAVGRTACFLNGCCYGDRCELPWAIFVQGMPRHPVQLYASFWEFAVLLILLLLEKRAKVSGVVFATWLILHGLGRVMMEHFRADPRGEFLAGFSISTWIGLGLALFGLATLLSLPIRLARNAGPRVAP